MGSDATIEREVLAALGQTDLPPHAGTDRVRADLTQGLTRGPS